MRAVVIGDRVVGKGVSGDPMKNTAHISLALAATAFTLVGAFFVQPPPAAARAGGEDLELTSSSFDQNRFAATGELLCGLTFADVADIIDHYGFTPNMTALADALSTPFDCGAYGQLCSQISEVDASEFVCATWDDMQRLAPAGTVIVNIRERLSEAGMTSCEPTPLQCAQACGAFNPVIYCTGVRINGGACIPAPDCGTPRASQIDFEIFDFLHE
jgi:hypothetical protein